VSDIRFIYAPIRGGKSLFAVSDLCKELEKSDRYIVTNLPLILCDPPSGYWTIGEYCQEFISKPVDLGRRLAVLTKEQTLEHWRYLPAGGLTPEQISQWRLEIIENVWENVRCRVAKLPLRPDVVYKELTDFSARDRRNGCFDQGCHYYIDEVHTLYSARNYRAISADAENYQSQLGKLDDDQTLISQHPEKVDKNFRRNATEWLRVQNCAKTPMFMGVTFARRFRYHHFQQPEMPMRGDKPDSSGWYRLEPKRRFHELYFTSAGVGVSGGIVSESNRFKGRHWSVWVVALVAIFAAAYFFPRTIQAGFTTALKSVTGSVQSGIVAAVPTTANMPHNNLGPPPVSQTTVVPHAPASLTGGGSLCCTSYARVGTNFWFVLSNGRILKTERGEVLGFGDAFVQTSEYGKVRLAAN